LKKIKAAKISRAIGAEFLQGNPENLYEGISIDSRQIKSGQLFFAMRGKNYDAHDYAVQAVSSGASGLVLERVVPDLPSGVDVFLVPDTLAALQSLARYNRSAFNIPVIAVTGSVGKTTTKDLMAVVLSVKFNTLKTTGNQNNEIGLPLTLLNLNESHEALVVEMAMRGPGEIDFLCGLALPNAAIITNIGEAHLGLLGSVENIAQAKGELLEHIPVSGFAVLNAQSPFIFKQAARCRGKVIFFGAASNLDIYARDIRISGEGSAFTVEAGGRSFNIFLPLPGAHNVLNALSVIGAALELGFTAGEITEGLARITLSGSRLEIIDLKDITVINDTYNANPSSVKAALEALAEVAEGKRKIAVLGDMLELGEKADSFHNQLGESIASTGVDYLITVGGLARQMALGAMNNGMAGSHVFICDSNAEGFGKLKELLLAGDVVLVKGSRGMRMEEIIQALIAMNH
jgi:UDP-N-acetylmuramoyl-tripeptide--D-alanyl-D-alanine ligase